MGALHRPDGPAQVSGMPAPATLVDHREAAMPDPRFEVLVSPSSPYPHDPASRSDGGRYSRLRVFAVLFVAAAVVGLGYTFVRAPVYRSTATLIVVPPDPVRLPDPTNVGPARAHGAQTAFAAGNAPDGSAAVQSQMIGGQSILSRLYGDLKNATPAVQGLPDSLSELERMLDVVPVSGTNMVELRAEGSPAALLPVLVNTWIDVYLKAYSASQQNDTDSTRTALTDQLDSLNTKIAAQRTQLQTFRKQYDIVSIKRDENRALARLKGLNTSLDKANDDRATAEAHLAALREALAQGEPMVRPQDQRGLDALEQQVVALQEELSNYRQLYTPAYMSLDQNIVATRRRLALLKEKLHQKRADSARAALSQAQQSVASARQVVAQLRAQLDRHRKSAADFSARLAQYQAMDDDLQQLQSMQRSSQDRLVQLQVDSAGTLPAVRVLERASTPGAPIRPLYLRDSGISVGAALAVGLLGIWLLEFLTRSGRDGAGSRPPPTLYTISGAASLPPDTPVRRLDRDEQPVPALAHTQPRELSPAEVRSLLDACDDRQRSLVCALLSGLRVEDAAALRWTDVDLQQGWMQAGQGPRLTLPAALKLLWRKAYPREGADTDVPVWSNAGGRPHSAAQLDAVIRAAAVYAGLNGAEEVDADALRHTYLAYLSRQGLEMDELARLAGSLTDEEYSRYSVLKPPGTVLPRDQVNTVYPAL